MWNVNILTLFPELFPGPLGFSVIGNALQKNIWSLNAHNIRDYASDKHATVDDTCYGGGAGMVLKPDVLSNAIDSTFSNGNQIIYLSPRGKKFTQKIAHEFANTKGINILSGRFEGVDERIFLEYDIMEISIGDYVLSSGDVAAYVLLDACIRLLDGVFADPNTVAEDSFGIGSGYESLLEYPQYTKPASWRGHDVPNVLLEGNHKLIEAWRLSMAVEKTKLVRPDLWDQCIYNTEKK